MMGIMKAMNVSLRRGDVFCEVDFVLVGVTAQATIWLLVLMVGEQVAAIRRPFVLRRLTLARKHLLCCLVYVLASLLCLQPYFGWGQTARPYGYGWWCSFDMYERSWWNRSFLAVLFTLSIVLPVGLILASYVLIYRHSFEQGGLGRQWTGTEAGAKRHRDRSRKLLWNSAAVLATFCLSWLPFAFLCVLIQLELAEVPAGAVEACAMFAKLYVLWNPVLVTFCSKRLRRDLSTVGHRLLTLSSARRFSAAGSGSRAAVNVELLTAPGVVGRRRELSLEQASPLLADQVRRSRTLSLHTSPSPTPSLPLHKRCYPPPTLSKARLDHSVVKRHESIIKVVSHPSIRG